MAAPPAIAGEVRLRLSRHVILRPGEDGFLLESSLDGRSTPVSTPALLRLLLALTRPVTRSELLGTIASEQHASVLGLLERWHGAGILTTVDDEGAADEDRGDLGAWQFHDLLFQARSRRGRNPARVGGSYPLRGVLPPEPLEREPYGGETVPLARPAAPGDGPPLGRVLEERRTLYSLAPVTLESLGELLFRTVRVTGVEHGDDEPLARRVYPSAGSRHPLEFYVVPWNCVGLAPGVWHYRPGAHELARVCDFGPEVELLLEEARAGTGGLGAYPPVLLLISARFRRVQWKYQSLAYGAILKEVGGVFQTLYLVATAMGLSPCALGAGDSDRFTRVTGNDFYRETTVGEFILGGPGGDTGVRLSQRIAAGEGRLGAALPDAPRARLPVDGRP